MSQNDRSLPTFAIAFVATLMCNCSIRSLLGHMASDESCAMGHEESSNLDQGRRFSEYTAAKASVATYEVT